MSFPYKSYKNVGSKSHRSRMGRFIGGTIHPCEKAYQDIFVENCGIDRSAVTLFENPSNVENGVIHRIFYKGQEVWFFDPTTVALMMEGGEKNELCPNHSLNHQYRSACFLPRNSTHLDLIIESILPSVASEEEVQDEIASAPTSVWCNTSTTGSGSHSTSALTANDAGVVIFRESRKINVESLVRASADAYQRVISVIPEREANVTEYRVVGIQGGIKTDRETDVDEDVNGREGYLKDPRDHDAGGVVVKTSTSMASDSSSVYLNQEDDELSAEQQEMVRSFGGVGCFVSVA